MSVKSEKYAIQPVVDWLKKQPKLFQIVCTQCGWCNKVFTERELEVRVGIHEDKTGHDDITYQPKLITDNDLEDLTNVRGPSRRLFARSMCK